MRKAILLFGILLTLLPFRTLGQYVSLGSEMQRYDWLSLAGQRSRLIYPRGGDSLARVAFGYVERFLPSVAFTPLRGTRFPIVMRARTAVPNGFVAWTPSRMELYTERFIYLFEIKVDSTPEAALQQIIDRDYALRHANAGKQIIGIGMSFDRTSHEYTWLAKPQGEEVFGPEERPSLWSTLAYGNDHLFGHRG